jgi:predicted membrane protein
VAVFPLPALGLILASLVFYAAAGLFDTTVFLFAVTLNWLIQIGFTPEQWRWRILTAVVLNMGLIGFFKYRNLLTLAKAHARPSAI